MEIRVRMAPSPTGNLHLGTAYTTLFNYLFAKKNHGKFILRIEDTDETRSSKEFEQNILDGLKWLGINWDEGPFYQMQRLPEYQKAADELLASRDAYYCFCTAEELEQERKDRATKHQPPIYSGKCRNLTADQVAELKKQGKPAVIRFKMPADRGEIVFNDLIHGRVAFAVALLGDMVIMRGNGIPLYNFAVVVDDIDMKITHVLRGEDHLSNTPKQIVLFEALGAKLPEFAHWPSILNPDRIGKLSKRENATSINDYQLQGYLPTAIVNYLALLGWTMPEDKEIMSLAEMESSFDLAKMRKSPAAFDVKKLDWMNGEYIRKLSDQQLADELVQFMSKIGWTESERPEIKQKIQVLAPLVKERIKKLGDFVPMTDFIFETPEYDQIIFDKILGDKSPELKKILDEITTTMEGLSKPWETKQFEEKFRALAEKLNLSASQMFQLIRVAISGQLVTPPLFESIQILGIDETINRMRNVRTLLETPQA